MKIEDAKALLIDCTDLICRECNDRHRGCEKQKSYPDFASTVLVALEKQIPKPPKPNTRIPGIGKCQICKTELCIDDDDLHYCPTCGQRLK
jgi:hypothetical protein